MIQDLHSHTYYSFCGKDKPEEIIEAAIAGGIELFGISDHAHGVGHGRKSVYYASKDCDFSDYEQTLLHYFDHINLLKEKYADKITLLRGIELNTGHHLARMPEKFDVSFFDYCLIENLDWKESITKGDLFAFAKRCGCTAGIAHTDLFGFLEQKGFDPKDYFKRMADANIFWEMNVSYDSTHGYREHPYLLEFFQNEAQQTIVRDSGVKLSVGFDGHKVEDYLPDRVAYYCRRLEELQIPMVFKELLQK